MGDIKEECGACKQACVDKYDLRCGFCTGGFNPVCLGMVNENLALLLNAMEILNINYYCSPCKEKISSFAVKCSEDNLPEDDEPLPLRVNDSRSEFFESENTEEQMVVQQTNVNENQSADYQIEPTAQISREIANEERPEQENRAPDREISATRAKTIVCKFHVKGNCRHNEDDCKFGHPVVCKHYTTYGECRFGDRCNYHHPQICKAAKNGRHCRFEKNCPFSHPKKIFHGKWKRSMNNNHFEGNYSGTRDGQVFNFLQEMCDMMMHMQERKTNYRTDHTPWRRENQWRSY